MGILLVYDVTDEASFSNIRNWMRNIEQHASDNVIKVLVGNKSDMEANRKVPFAKGKALADEYGIMFFETSAKSNINIDEVRTFKESTPATINFSSYVMMHLPTRCFRRRHGRS